MHNVNSTELAVGQQLPRRAQLLISEIVDSELLGEGILPTLRHAMVGSRARRRMLRQYLQTFAHPILIWLIVQSNLVAEDAVIVPATAAIYAQAVECEALWDFERLPRWMDAGQVRHRDRTELVSVVLSSSTAR